MPDLASLPTWTRTIDQAFLSTWVDIQPVAIDNITLATPVQAALKQCEQTQRGGSLITRTLTYNYTSPTAVSKGDQMTQGEPELDTMARWTWRYKAHHVQRSVQDDQQNSGEYQIKSLVTRRLEDVRVGFAQTRETDFLRAVVTGEGGKEMQGLNDIVPPYASRATGTYGMISRPSAYTVDTATSVASPSAASTTNSFWGPKYIQLVAPYEVNLVANLTTLYNALGENTDNPDLLLTNQNLFEILEEYGMDRVQQVGNATLLSLGFQTIRFKTCDVIWSANVNGALTNEALMLNRRYIEVIHDPGLWFEMTEFKYIGNQLERIAHIIKCENMICTQLRRQGRATAETVS